MFLALDVLLRSFALVSVLPSSIVQAAATKTVMPQRYPRLGSILFRLQIAFAVGVILFASQEEKFAWTGTASSG